MKHNTEFWACMIISAVWIASTNKYADVFALIWLMLALFIIVFSPDLGKDK